MQRPQSTPLLGGSSACADELDAKPLDTSPDAKPRDTSLDEFPDAIKKMESAKGKDAFALAQEMNKHTRDRSIKSVIVETLSGMCYGGKSPSQFAERVNSLLKKSKPGFRIAITEPTEQRGMFGRTCLRMVTVTGPDESMWIGELQYGDGSKAGVGEALGR